MGQVNIFQALGSISFSKPHKIDKYMASKTYGNIN